MREFAGKMPALPGPRENIFQSRTLPDTPGQSRLVPIERGFGGSDRERPGLGVDWLIVRFGPDCSGLVRFGAGYDYGWAEAKVCSFFLPPADVGSAACVASATRADSPSILARLGLPWKRCKCCKCCKLSWESNRREADRAEKAEKGAATNNQVQRAWWRFDRRSAQMRVGILSIDRWFGGQRTGPPYLGVEAEMGIKRDA